MVVLDILIYLNYLNIGDSKDFSKKGKIIAMQIGSTVFSILAAGFAIYTESRGLKEDVFEYTMVSVKAKQDWVPFGNKIKNRDIG